MHYLVDIIEKKYPELLTFGDELPHLDRASKISIETIQKTMTQMRNDLKNLQTDINNCKSLPNDDDDKFEEVMTVSFRRLIYVLTKVQMITSSGKLLSIVFITFNQWFGLFTQR